MKKKRHDLIKNISVMAVVFLVASGSSIILQKTGVHEHITAIFIFAVFLTSILTDGYIYGIVSALVGTLAVNYAYTYPFYALNFRFQGNMVSAVVMMAIAVLTGMLTTQVKTHEAIKVESEKERMRANLLRAVSHDLRTPLCSISGNADMLLNNERCLDDITKQQIYTDIYDDAEWLIGVVENLLSITRLNDGRLKIKFTDQLLDEVIAESLRHISRKHDAYKIQVECEELILAHMDVRLIIQVLVNLIDNAIKYTPQGSTICIRGLRTDGRAQISVEDNGPGIADEMKSHIFEMFYTGKTTIADSHRSLGLGLALCHSIIEAHEGELTLKDNYPHGCIFVFTLPLSEVTLNE